MTYFHFQKSKYPVIPNFYLGGKFQLFTCSPRFSRSSLAVGYRCHLAR
jgi:hypothetical protein